MNEFDWMNKDTVPFARSGANLYYVSYPWWARGLKRLARWVEKLAERGARYTRIG